MPNDHEVLTMKEICDLLQVNQSTVYKLLRERSIPGFRVGSDWRFRRDVIERWMTEQSTGSQQASPKHSPVLTLLAPSFRHHESEKALSTPFDVARFVLGSQ
jgi:excisionase family DNA binding protein